MRFDESSLHYQSYKKNTKIAGILSLPYLASLVVLLTTKNESLFLASGITTVGLFIPTVILGIKSNNAMSRSVFYYNRDVAIYGKN